MKTIALFDAKTNLSEIIRQVDKGESFTITRHGKPIAELKPISQDRSMKWQEVRSYFEEARKKVPKTTPEEVREWINDGRE